MSDVTRILDRAREGDPQAAEELLPLVYEELRRLAAAKMAQEKPGQTLQPTALVHEAWLRLAGSADQHWQNRRHFIGAAAEAMRRILIDRARKRNRTRHGHGLERINLDELDIAAEADEPTLQAVDEALTRLAAESPERAELVKLRYFVGLNIPEAAAALGISESTANYIARWNATNWLAMGAAGIDSPVAALAVSGSDVFIGGFFTTAGGQAANRIAKWNGSSWSPLGSGMGGPFTPVVRTLTVVGNEVFAGGEFTTAGSTAANYIAKWDGSSWSPLGSGINYQVYALASNGDSLYAGGWFSIAGGKVSANLAKVRVGSVATSIIASGGTATMQFSGVVGHQYDVQRVTSIAQPVTWTTVSTSPLSPADDGSLGFTDTNAPPGAAYYRLVQH